MSKTFFISVCLVLCFVATCARNPVSDPPAAADTIRPIEPRPMVRAYGSDSVIMPRAAFLKYDLARTTLLQMSFDDIDALISLQRQQLQACEQAKDRIYAQAQQALHLARDSLRSAQLLIPVIKRGTENAVVQIQSAGRAVSSGITDVRTARRQQWADRFRAGLAGAGIALFIDLGIRLIR